MVSDDVKPFLLGGAWRVSASDETFEVRHSWTQETLARVSVPSRDEAEEAIAAAETASAEMRHLPRHKRAEALHVIAATIRERREDFARTIAVEAGKPVTLARAEVERAIMTFTFASEEARRFAGEMIPLDAQASGANRVGFTERIPRGVVFGITPFNFPLNLVAHKVAPALASGNAIIIKPSPRTPLSALLLGEVFLQTDLPRAALQIIPMDVRDIDSTLR